MAEGTSFRISCIRLQVRDVESSAAFYSALFGLDVHAHPLLGDRVRECTTRTNGTRECLTFVLSQGHQDSLEHQPLEYISLEVPTLDDANSMYQRAVELGAQAIAPRLYDGGWRGVIFDADGHKFEVVVRGSIAQRTTVRSSSASAAAAVTSGEPRCASRVG